MQNERLARERRQPLSPLVWLPGVHLLTASNEGARRVEAELLVGRLHVKALVQYLHQDREQEDLRRLDHELGWVPPVNMVTVSVWIGPCTRRVRLQVVTMELAAGRSGVAEGPAKAVETCIQSGRRVGS